MNVEQEALLIAQKIIQNEKMQQAISTLQKLDVKVYEKVFYYLKQILIKNRQYKNPKKMIQILLIEYICKQDKNFDIEMFKCSNIFELIAVTQGYLSKQIYDKVRTTFIKNLSREINFWGMNNLITLHHYFQDKNNYCLLWDKKQYTRQIQYLSYFINFLQTKGKIFAPTFPIWDYLLKYMLMIRQDNQVQKQLFQQFLNQFLSYQHHYRILSNNFRFLIQFFRSIVNSKNTLYYPQKSLITLLSRYQDHDVENLVHITSIGMIWDLQSLSACIVNCIFLGITPNTVRLILAFIQCGKNNHKHAQLITIFSENINKIFVFIRYPRLFACSLKIMKEFMLGPISTSLLYSIFIQKAINFVKFVTSENKIQYLQFLETVCYKYKDSTLTTEIQQVIQQELKENNYYHFQEKNIEKLINKYAWNHQNIEPIKNLNRNHPTYKGLTNLGNSCYMNSFLQCLYMTPYFRQEILTTSTLALEKQVLQKLKSQDEKQSNLSVTARQIVRPLAELQRLFALLYKSQKPYISAHSVKSSGSVEFRNNLQQDTIQYGRSLLEMVERTTLKHKFEGQHTITINCPNCLTLRHKEQVFKDLMLYNSTEQQDLTNMIQHSLQPEEIDNLYCDFCASQSKKSVKKHSISVLPEFIILTVKRFSYDSELKISVKQKYKIELKSNFYIQNQQYNVYALIVHRGQSVHSGHYYTFCRDNYDLSHTNEDKTKNSQLQDNIKTNSQNLQWICFNDSQIIQILDMNSEDTPYVFFAQKTSSIKQINKNLVKPVILRPPLQKYIDKDNIQFIKSSKKTPLVGWNNFQAGNQFNYRKDSSDDDQDNHEQAFNHFNTPIL